VALWRAFNHFSNVCRAVVLWRYLLGIWNAGVLYLISVRRDGAFRKLPGPENPDLANSARPLHLIHQVPRIDKVFSLSLYSIPTPSPADGVLRRPLGLVLGSPVQ